MADKKMTSSGPSGKAGNPAKLAPAQSETIKLGKGSITTPFSTRVTFAGGVK